MEEEFARIKVDGKYSFFIFRDQCIKFRTSTKLRKYLQVKEWDNGYLVVECRGKLKGVFEEYIDLAYILEILYMDPQTFLRGVEEVRIAHA